MDRPDERAVATVTNAEDAAQFVDRTVQSLGFDNPRLSDLEGSVELKVNVTNVLYAVVAQLRESANLRQRQEDELHRALNDVALLRTRVDTAKRETEATAAQRHSAQEKLRQLEKKSKKGADQLAKTKDELRLLKVETARLATQYDHTARKQEKECQKLKERLQKLVSDKNNEKKLGMRLLNSLSRPDGSRGTWGNRNKADNELHTQIVAQYEGKLKDLVLENKELRLSLASLERELVTVLNSQGGGAPADPATSQAVAEASTTAAAPFISSERASPEVAAAAADATAARVDPHDQFALPYGMAREGIEESLRLKMEEVKGVFAELEAAALSGSAAPVQDTAKIDVLQRQLDECAQIIEQQQAALLDAPVSPDKSFLSESLLVDRAEELARDRAELAAKEATFEAERTALTQLAVNHDVKRVKAIEAIRTPRGTPAAVPPKVPRPRAEQNVDLSRYLQF
mmetsp:Transcript_4990/g.12922  ORF Transcript_4990/g.12922 Transcript_4990/m.12922 type:complete len:459 (+) Transcript_4990:183-1559(+)|eukprot:CAMPEP_0206300204 /NCGR_PEP_ID=MMETSP0106_2-20121207/7581_1 /ASSEMBLY_ACC=CAM_ASM_000206 /TAXON_ID=81532 /ORGANISM="Acanthoeca-like sp., Strain 10tr" /LENGTH=458 /DNA_ID=CAMNT_0053730921 /DNA_START=97 /DNA_END=1473 /DNA_ORIENTATION=+